MAMPGGQGGPMGMQGQMGPQQQQMLHQQMVAQQQAQAQAAAAAAAAQAQQQQQQMGMNPQGMPSMMGGGPGGPQGPPGMMGVGGPGQPTQQQQMQQGPPHPGQMGNPGGPGSQSHPGHPMANQPGGPPPGQGPPHPGQQQPHPGQQQQQPHPLGPGQMVHPEQSRLDNISKAKSLVVPIKDTLSNVLRTAANAIYNNNMVDCGLKKADSEQVNKFDRALEEFFSLCDQMEVHLKTSMECINQGISSSRYLQTPVTLSKMEGSLTYPQYISVVKGQIAYAKDVHGTLADAAQKLSE